MITANHVLNHSKNLLASAGKVHPTWDDVFAVDGHLIDAEDSIKDVQQACGLRGSQRRVRMSREARAACRRRLNIGETAAIVALSSTAGVLAGTGSAITLVQEAVKCAHSQLDNREHWHGAKCLHSNGLHMRNDLVQIQRSARDQRHTAIQLLNRIGELRGRLRQSRPLVASAERAQSDISRP